MSFLDNLRDKFRAPDDDYYDDYEDDYYEDEPDQPQQQSRREETSGLLGNTRRPEAESVSVYTRSGRPVGPGAQGAGHAPQGRQREGAPGYAPRPEYAPRTTLAPGVQRGYDDYADDTTQMPSGAVPYAGGRGSSVLGNTTDGRTPADMGLKPTPRVSSGQLPPYVLKPVSYDDVQMVVRRVRTNQPVVLAFRNTNIETAKRILDFCFGLACGIGGQVDELGDRVFVVMPAGLQLSQADLDKLVSDGTLQR